MKESYLRIGIVKFFYPFQMMGIHSVRYAVKNIITRTFGLMINQVFLVMKSVDVVESNTDLTVNLILQKTTGKGTERNG